MSENNTAPDPTAQESGPEPGLPIAQLARRLGVHARTLGRALKADPAAPDPAFHDDLGHPRYTYSAITSWWPTRRSRGRPRQRAAGEQASDRPQQQADSGASHDT